MFIFAFHCIYKGRETPSFFSSTQTQTSFPWKYCLATFYLNKSQFIFNPLITHSKTRHPNFRHGKMRPLRQKFYSVRVSWRLFWGITGSRWHSLGIRVVFSAWSSGDPEPGEPSSPSSCCCSPQAVAVQLLAQPRWTRPGFRALSRGTFGKKIRNLAWSFQAGN